MRIWNRIFTVFLFFHALSSEARIPRAYLNENRLLAPPILIGPDTHLSLRKYVPDPNPIEMSPSLFTPQTRELHPIVSKKNYTALLQLNDLSYVIAKIHTLTDQATLSAAEQIQLAALTQRLDEYYQSLRQSNWEGFDMPIGATGARNQEADPSCIIAVNRSEHLIIVTFHGSRSGSLLWNTGNGDWGANLDSEVVLGKNIGINYIKHNIEIHRGFGNNFQSVQSNLNASLSDILDRFSAQELEQTWVWVNGHSKGAALASLAAPVIKKYLHSKRRNQFRRVNVGAFLFSAPRVFHGDDSQIWAESHVGKENIFRIHVEGDPVTAVPTYTYHGFRSLGMLFVDRIAAVNRRTSRFYHTDVSGWFDLNAWMGYHYVSNLRMRNLPHLSNIDSQEFDPNIVLPYKKLQSAYLADESQSSILPHG